MAQSKCPNQNCPSLKENKDTVFELKKSNFKSPYTYYFVQCATCGTVISVLDKKNTEAVINSVLLPQISPFLLNDDNDKIMEELILQSEAIKLIMKTLKIEV